MQERFLAAFVVLLISILTLTGTLAFTDADEPTPSVDATSTASTETATEHATPATTPEATQPGTGGVPATAAPASTPIPTLPVVTPDAETPPPTVEPSPTAEPTPTPIPTPSPAPSLPLVENAPGQTEAVPILMYHYVRPDPGPDDPLGQDLSVTPEDFAEQIAYLAAQGYNTLTMAELADVRANRAVLPENPIVLTFDDGYRDFYEAAWPVLRQHGFKATLFVITAVVEQPVYVTWAMIDELDKSGLVEIASHTVHHYELPYISDEEARAEVVESKAVLEQHLGHAVRSFCYPVGRFSDRDVVLLREAGYEIAVTTVGGYAEADDEDLLLPRVRIHGVTAIDQIRANFP